MKRPRARRWANAPTVALVFAIQFAHPAAAEDAAADFVRIAKTQISGKTGRPVESIELFPEGQLLRKDGDGAVLFRARVSPAELASFANLLSEPALFSKPVCGRPLGADLSSTELAVQFEHRTLILQLPRHCEPPRPAAQLLELFDAAEREHLSPS